MLQQKNNARFECFQNPLGKWMIWDSQAQWWAQLANRELVDLSEEEARAVHAALTRGEPTCIDTRKPKLRLVASR